MTNDEVFAAMTTMQYWLNGARIQVSGPCGSWVDVADNEFPSWDWSSYRWRVKPHTDPNRDCDQQRPIMPPPICTWVYDGDYSKWDTDCGEAFELSNDATLCDNKIQFCPFCGKRINEVV